MRVEKPTLEQVERVLDAYLRDVNAADFTPRTKKNTGGVFSASSAGCAANTRRVRGSGTNGLNGEESL